MLEKRFRVRSRARGRCILVVDYQRSGRQSQHSALLDQSQNRSHPRRSGLCSRNLNKTLSVEDLAQAAGLSSRQLTRIPGRDRNVTGQGNREAAARQRAVMIEQSRILSKSLLAKPFRDQERMRRAFVRLMVDLPQALRGLATGSAN